MKMKKFLVIGLAVALSACLVACNGNKEENQGQQSGDVQGNGQQNQEVAQGTATGDASGDMIALATAAELQVNAPYQDYITAEMAFNFVGLTEDEFNANVEEGVFFESMMSPANQSYCLLKVKEGIDVDALKQKVFDNANPRKWICMSADRVLVMADSEYVMLAMGPVETLDTLKTEFAELAGGDLKETLDRTVNAGDELPEDLLPGSDDLYIIDPELEDEVLEVVISGDDASEENVSGDVEE